MTSIGFREIIKVLKHREVLFFFKHFQCLENNTTKRWFEGFHNQSKINDLPNTCHSGWIHLNCSIPMKKTKTRVCFSYFIVLVYLAFLCFVYFFIRFNIFDWIDQICQFLRVKSNTVQLLEYLLSEYMYMVLNNSHKIFLSIILKMHFPQTLFKMSNVWTQLKSHSIFNLEWTICSNISIHYLNTI